MTQSILKVVFSHAPKYLTGSVITGGATLLMTKYYTSVFSTEEFGILAIYLLMFKYVSSLTSLNLDSSSSRFYFDYRETRRDEYLSTIFWLITAIAISVCFLALLLMKYISGIIYENSEDIYIVTLIMGIASVYVSFLTRILYNEHRSSSVLKHSIFQTFANHTLSFIFIYFINLGVFGRILGQCVGYILNITTLLKEFSSRDLFNIKVVFNRAMARETFVLAIPSMISMLLGVLFLYADRFFLKYYLGDSAVGIYSLGYMLGQSLSLIYEAVSQAILPKIFNDLNDNYNKSIRDLESFSYKYYATLIIVTILVSVSSPIIVSVFSNESYEGASGVMPFVMAGFMMGGIYKISSLVLGFHKIVWFYPFLSIASFGTNMLLNWILIPKYGMLGSAYASFSGIFIYSLVLQLMVRKYMNKSYNFYSNVMYFSVFCFVSFCFIQAV